MMNGRVYLEKIQSIINNPPDQIKFIYYFPPTRKILSKINNILNFLLDKQQEDINTIWYDFDK